MTQFLQLQKAMSSARILLVEDNDLDAEIIQRGFASQKIVNQIERVRDGVEALDRLNECAADGQLPVVLLDLKMPRMDGNELLEHIRSTPTLAHALVFVLTASTDVEDKKHAFGHHVAGYILKQKAGENFIRMFQLFEHYWTVVEMPEGLGLEFRP